MIDQAYMAQALRLAEQGLYSTHPNPRVGCVIVADQHVVAEGWHVRAGEPHAEVHALRQAGALAQGATAYVTLEPCPMCAGAILNSRLSRVVYGSRDSRFGGCGTTIDVLSHNALCRVVAVTPGILAEEGLGILQAFFQEMREKKGDSGVKTVAQSST